MKKIRSDQFWCGLCLALAVFVAGSCRKDAVAPQDSGERYTVKFRFREFGASISPLAGQGLRGRPFTKLAATNPTQTTEEGYLYYWSFNAGDLVPDIRVSTGSKISYNGEGVPGNFTSGWVFDTFAAGKAMSLTGAQELTFELPLANVQEVRSLGFDIGSSSTGPKSFDLLYSQDGQHYDTIMVDNQFSNTNTSQAKNAFVFHIDTLTLDLTAPLFVRLVPLAGKRGSAGNYNPTTGVMKVDNFRLVGISESTRGVGVSKLHYHIFDATNGNLVLAGEETFSPGQLPSLSLSLPPGNYHSSFAANESEAGLILGGYYFSNTFSNHLAKVFGVVDTFAVQGDSDANLVLERYYSRVKFEFTDTGDLSEVGRIVFTPAHEPYFYAPFATGMANPVLDQSDISVTPDFANTGKELTFHQFMGRLPAPGNLSYTVEVYDAANVLLRTFSVSASIKNNVQLVFRGDLLSGTNAKTNNGFSVAYDKNWNGNVEKTF